MLFLKIFIFFFFFVLFILFIFLKKKVLKYKNNKSKNIQFESGVKPFNNSNKNFFVNYYLFLSLFIIFDIETVYLYLLSTQIIDIGWIGFLEVFSFIFTLLICILYIIKSKSLNL
ncbi:MAG: NADH-quinone oxidoreductase subunit A [Enterobacteriaceae bacterium]